MQMSPRTLETDFQPETKLVLTKCVCVLGLLKWREMKT